ncbi:MAG: hypothetical protein M1819_006787 [Sarea resinae]|nr:MAG: hypothetical protein M1819_006787 [Sarea resinae]
MQPSPPPEAPPSPTSHSRISENPHSLYKRHKIRSNQWQPPESLQPIGQGPQFQYFRRTPGRSSEASSEVSMRSPEMSVNEGAEREGTVEEPAIRERIVQEGDFTVEEVLDDGPGYEADLEVMRPDNYEEADSSNGEGSDKGGQAHDPGTGIVNDLRKLHCDGDLVEGQDQQGRRYKEKKKRWSAGIFKRSHSQSIGSDSDLEDEEALDAHDIGCSARRLRRRVKGPTERSSMIFDDIPPLDIAEVEEPDDSSNERPNTGSSDMGSYITETLPAWLAEDHMEVDSDAGH